MKLILFDLRCADLPEAVFEFQDKLGAHVLRNALHSGRADTLHQPA